MCNKIQNVFSAYLLLYFICLEKPGSLGNFNHPFPPLSPNKAKNHYCLSV